MFDKISPIAIAILIIIGLFALGKILVVVEALVGLAILGGVSWLILKYFIYDK